MNIDVFTLFPGWFEWFVSQRHVSNALAAGSRLECVNPRDHTPLSGGQVDDTPFGGGAGMVLRVDVLDSALRAHYGIDPVTLRSRRRVIALAPGGRLLDEQLVQELAGEPELTLLCGRYEGFDERILEHFASDVVSIGRYVLSGGELAAMVLCDAVLRKLPGALGRRALRRGGVLQRCARRAPRVPALHAPSRVPRLAGAGGAALRPPRADRALAARAQPRTWRRRGRLSLSVGSSRDQRGAVCRRFATIAPRAGRDLFSRLPRRSGAPSFYQS